MEATADLLTELGVEPVMTTATVQSLRAIDQGAVAVRLAALAP
jgi:hypothetical protein